MLIYEQYFMVYLLALLVLKDKDLKIISGFVVVDYLIDNIIYNLILSPVEYIISISVLEIIILVFMLPFINNTKLRAIFSFCFILTLINPYFILGIDYFITRGDDLSYYLYLFCENSSRYANELFISYLIYTLDKRDLRSNFWTTFTICNYLIIIAQYFKEI